MMTDMKYLIKFPNQALTELRKNLLADLTNEYYACLLAKTHIISDLCIITVIEAVYPDLSYYKRQGTASLKVSWDFMREVLTEADSRLDVNTVIDVHTHPFSEASAWFSGTDDRDEETFARYLHDKAPDLHYASIECSRRRRIRRAIGRPKQGAGRGITPRSSRRRRSASLSIRPTKKTLNLRE